MTRSFLSCARSDDAEPFDPPTSFVARLHRDLTARGFEVWFDRITMPSRRLTFHQEIQDAVAARERLVLVVGPKGALSDYVRQEWQIAFRADKAVIPILHRASMAACPPVRETATTRHHAPAGGTLTLWRTNIMADTRPAAPRAWR